MGIREFKASLSAYLRRVARGEQVVVTDRGRPVARVIPAGLPPGLVRLVEEGRLHWSGRKPAIPRRRPRVRGNKTLADLVSEDRE